MDQKTLEYAAGLFDADGCVRIARQKVKNKNRYDYGVRAYISNKSSHLLDWVVENFGGRHVPDTNKKGDTWNIWYLQSRQTVPAFLTQILPYLKIKRKQAELVLAFAARKDMTPSEKEAAFFEVKRLKIPGSLTTDTQGEFLLHHPAYLAGFFDGDGSVMVTKSGRSYHLEAKITNEDVPTLDLLISLFGGDKTHKGESVYDWYLCSKATIKTFLNFILPYLKLKRIQAIEALKYIGIGRTQNPSLREQFKIRLSEMKNDLKIQPELVGDYENASTEMLNA